MRALILAAAIALAAAPAFAADPCERGPSSAKIGGADIDSLRCRDAILLQVMGQKEMTILTLQAELALAKKDAEAARATAAAVRDQWEGYFASYIGATPTK